MLYLGGNLTKILEKDMLNVKQKPWIKMQCLTTQSYIINASAYDDAMVLLSRCQKPIDVYYQEDMHQNEDCFMINPQMTTQKDGYSDIEKKVLKYNLELLDDFIEIQDAPHEHNKINLIINNSFYY